MAEENNEAKYKLEFVKKEKDILAF